LQLQGQYRKTKRPARGYSTVLRDLREDEVDAFSEERWLRAETFKAGWQPRSEQMANLLLNKLPDLNTISVFGSGPHHSMEKAIHSRSPYIKILSYDLRSWDTSTKVLNLDTADLGVLPNSECAIFSGVLEYVDIEHVITSAMNKFPVVMFSYAFIGMNTNSERALIKICSKRILVGWKNHRTIPWLIDLVSSHGFLIDIQLPKAFRNQVYILASSRNR
jgi:hypothetical protein